MTKRKTISKKNRFEIFKRDKFICQFCGNTPPGVVLEIDHIKPVCEGGTNELINLVTSCFDCNRGKGPRELDDKSALVAQKNQLDILQEKREQMDLMLQWSDGLRELDNDLNDNVIKRINEKMAPFSINESYKKNIANITKKHTLVDILKAIDISAEKYLRFDYDGSTTEESAKDYVNKISGILFNLNRSELERKISYIKGICRNRFSYWNDVTGAIILNKYVGALKDAEWSDEEIVKDLINEIIPRSTNAKHWTDWKELLERWTREIQEDNLDSELEEENEQAEKEAQKIANDVQWDIAKKYAQELIDSRHILIEGFHSIGENFSSFNSDQIESDFNQLVLGHINHFIEDPSNEDYSYQKLGEWCDFYSHFENPAIVCKYKDPIESLSFFLIDPISSYLYRFFKYEFNSDQLHHIWGCFFNAIATPIQRERFRRDEFAANFIKEIIEAQNIWLEKCKLNAA